MEDGAAVAQDLPRVTCEKPKLPTLWLDTSVVIKLAKIKRGEHLQDIEIRRSTRLRELVLSLTRAKKLLCPESDQEEEYVAQRLDDDVHSMFASLSFGISLRHRLGIFDEHVFKGMSAFAKRSKMISLPSSTFFFGNPVKRVEENSNQRFFVSLGLNKNPEMIQRRAEAKQNVFEGWERLRQEHVANGQSYEEQVQAESRGYWSSLAQAVRTFESDILAQRPNFVNFMAAQGALTYRYYWSEIGGQPRDWEGVHAFFHSPYFSELPLPFIGTRLCAALLTGNETIVPSDPMDVELLEIALPVSNYVVTDRRMEVRIKELGLDIKFGTEVYSMSTIDGLFARLEKL